MNLHMDRICIFVDSNQNFFGPTDILLSFFNYILACKNTTELKVWFFGLIDI